MDTNKLKQSLIFILIFTAPFFSIGQQKDPGIDFFQGSWKEVKQKAKEEGKPIFVDAFATWCGPCKWMDAKVFTRNDVGNFYNDKFINYRYDMEKGNGKRFAKKHNVKFYPSFLFFSSDGEVIHRDRGAKKPDGFISLGKKALTNAN